MSQELKELSRRWFEEVWNKGNGGEIERLFAKDGVAHGVSEGEPLRGPAGFREFYDHFRQGFSGIRVTVEDVLAEGEKSVVRFSFTAVHSGPALGIPATGRQVRATAITIMRWREGQIVEAWNEFDVAGLLGQLHGPAVARIRA